MQRILLLFMLFVTSLYLPFAHALLPYPYLVRNQLASTLTSDPCVKVSGLHAKNFQLRIAVKVCELEKARALATFVNRAIDVGGEQLYVVVTHNNIDVEPYAAPTTLDVAEKLINMALTGNNYFVKTINENFYFLHVIIKPEVIQFLSDDMLDYYNNTNQVAANAFQAILKVDNLPFKIAMSTLAK